MKLSILILFVSASLVFVTVGCSSSPTPAATQEQKKAFAGSAPPADYMKNVKTNPSRGTPPATTGGQ